MARIYGLNGLIRGRQGNNVFSIQNGTQVVKAYNPSVFNPKSIGQREQRARFALAGKLSAATPAMAISGLNGSSQREKRARLVSQVIKGSSVSGTIDNLVASIPITNIRWSEGSVNRQSFFFSATAVYDSYSVVATVPAMSLTPSAPAGYGEMVVCGMFDTEGRALDQVQAAIRNTTTANTFTFRETPTRVAATVAVWVCPFQMDESISEGVSSNLFPQDGSLSMRVRSSTTLSGRKWGVSEPQPVIEVSPATTSVAPSPSDDDNRHVTDTDNGDVMKTAKKK